MPPRWLAVVLVPAAALAGCTQSGAEPVVERERTIEPDGFLEINLRMPEDGQLRYEWSTEPARELAFDVHSHPSQGQARYHERVNATEKTGTFTADGAGTYSLLWANPTEVSVTVDVQVDGDVELDSVAP